MNGNKHVYIYPSKYPFPKSPAKHKENTSQFHYPVVCFLISNKFLMSKTISPPLHHVAASLCKSMTQQWRKWSAVFILLVFILRLMCGRSSIQDEPRTNKCKRPPSPILRSTKKTLCQHNLLLLPHQIDPRTNRSRPRTLFLLCICHKSSALIFMLQHNKLTVCVHLPLLVRTSNQYNIVLSSRTNALDSPLRHWRECPPRAAWCLW